jgi:hypothetical protein
MLIRSSRRNRQTDRWGANDIFFLLCRPNDYRSKTGKPPFLRLQACWSQHEGGSGWLDGHGCQMLREQAVRRLQEVLVTSSRKNV